MDGNVQIEAAVKSMEFSIHYANCLINTNITIPSLPFERFPLCPTFAIKGSIIVNLAA